MADSESTLDINLISKEDEATKFWRETDQKTFTVNFKAGTVPEFGMTGSSTVGGSSSDHDLNRRFQNESIKHYRDFHVMTTLARTSIGIARGLSSLAMGGGIAGVGGAFDREIQRYVRSNGGLFGSLVGNAIGSRMVAGAARAARRLFRRSFQMGSWYLFTQWRNRGNQES